MAKGMKPGQGGRFAALKDKFASKGVKDPGGLAAYVGAKKYGKGKMESMAQTGRARANK